MSDDRHGWRLRAMIVVLWRAGLRVQEALALAASTKAADATGATAIVRTGRGGARPM